MQRAEFVASREELDQMYDCYSKGGGDLFLVFAQLREETSNRSLGNSYEQQKMLAFYQEVLNSVKNCVQADRRHLKRIEHTQEKLTPVLAEATVRGIVVELAAEFDLCLDTQTLRDKCRHNSQAKDHAFEKRYLQLRQLSSEIAHYEGMIKQNANVVDN